MNKKTTIAVVIAVVVVFVIVGGVGFSDIISRINGSKTTMNSDQAKVDVKEVKVGTGDIALAGKEVTVHYTGVFTDGTKFDSSRDRGVPFTFKLGSGMVIKGWDIGVEGMKVGGKRILIIPSEFGYGATDNGPIPANSTLIFEVELLGVK